jgi:hypothetical protein
VTTPDRDAWLAGPFYPKHPPEHAPRGHPAARVLRRVCPRCGSGPDALVTAAGWEWCFSHDHPKDGPPVYRCSYERKSG